MKAKWHEAIEIVQSYNGENSMSSVTAGDHAVKPQQTDLLPIGGKVAC